MSLPANNLAASAEVVVDVAHSLVRYTLSGFFDVAGVAAFEAQRRRGLATLRCGPNRHVTLLDVSGCRIQTQEVVARFADMLRDRRWAARALAIVVGSSIARMQLRRILDRDEIGWFATVAEAEAWLLPRAPAPRQPAPTASATDPNPSRARQASSSASIRIGSPGPA